MSDLKHMTVEQLRAEVRSLTSARARYARQWELMEEEIVELQGKIKDLRTKSHNLGQREAWARTYLARKELGE